MSYQLGPAEESQQQGGYDARNNTYEHNNNNDGYGYGYGYGYGQQTAYTEHQQQQQQQPYHITHTPSQVSSPTTSPQAASATVYYHHHHHHHQDGVTRAQTWVSNQQPLASPPPMAKTPLGEWSENTLDYRTPRGYSPTMPPRPRKEDQRVWGIKRNTFFIVVAIGLFLLVVAIAAGLGVGLGTRRTSSVAVSVAENSTANSSPPAAIQPTTTTPTSTTRSSSSTTKASPTPSFTGTLTPGPIICPQNNNTVYVSRGSSKPFNVQCGRDYNSAGGATDLAHMYKASMAQCVDACGDRPGCVGVGWGNSEGTTECWLKSGLGEPNFSPNWYFAQLQDMDLASS
ncbi:uncharacterized protein F4812DRAFT_332115 [Daldinia caldariorum]|uniref:uncharacterized protein n=1 Tax=Daldinia caldariorum TaxID=326644 RepID=UPI0020089735|nr:uncharacterized protein F4812DRAFT_332115 [Daldinia caldariorum]KAI1469492.1 hypothetical protein F4812DRAFT_332115 [Daldinia caldariorum]